MLAKKIITKIRKRQENKKKEIQKRKKKENLDKYVRLWEENGRKFSKKGICLLFDIPFDGEDEIYSRICYVGRAKKGSLALVPWGDDDIDDEKKEILDNAVKANGASRLLCSKEIEGYPCLVISEKKASKMIKKIMSPIREKLYESAILVTGSYGKTSTASMIEAVLKYKYDVFARIDGNNNMVSSALIMMQEMDICYKAFIQEAAEAPSFGACGSISKIIRPKIAVITSVGNAHLETMKTKERILESCLTSRWGLSKKDGIIITNGDDPMLWNVETNRKTKYYGCKNKQADYFAEDIHIEEDKITFEVCYQEERKPAVIYCNGIHNVQNAMAAIAVGNEMGMSLEDCIEGLKTYKTKGIRQNLVKVHDRQLYLDCFNACEESIESAIKTIESIKIPKGGKRIAVIADVKELGEESEKIHRKIGKQIGGVNIDRLLCYGEEAKYIAEEAAKSKRFDVKRVYSIQEISDYIKNSASKKDIVLLKGSHSMELEKVYEELKGEK